MERYGRSDIGRHMLLARRMLEAGVTFVKVTRYGWDTHGDNFNGHASLVPKFDQAFAAMIEDLAGAAMLDNVLVVAMSEFGRTPRINGHLGRDHWPEAWSLVMAGAGSKPGVVAGKTNDKGTWVTSEEQTSATCSTPGSMPSASIPRKPNTTTTASLCPSRTRTACDQGSDGMTRQTER